MDNYFYNIRIFLFLYFIMINQIELLVVLKVKDNQHNK